MSTARLADDDTIVLGAAATDITPAHPVELAGFATRSGRRSGIRSRLELQAFAFADAVLVCADLLWWGPDVADRLRDEIAERHGLRRSAVLLHASHTHSAPMPGLTFSPSIGAGDPDYLRQLERLAHTAIDRAMADRRPVWVFRGTGVARIGMSRRRKNSDGSIGGADPTAPVGQDVTVVRFQDVATQRTRALLVHYACHPVITDDRQVSADYPGALRRQLRDSGSVVGFLQGCCGDVDPALLTADGEFRRGDTGDVDRLGGILAAAARTAVDSATQLGGNPSGSTRIAETATVSRERAVPLPLQRPTDSDLAAVHDADTIWGDWSRRLAERPTLPDDIDCTLNLLQPIAGLALLGIDAEITAPYAQWLRQRHGDQVIPLAYTNGMIGYICTAEQIADGGYEPAHSYPYIYRPGQLDPHTQHRLTTAIDSILLEA
ncbi:MAG: neutral/alkaline non-lysosomal ceramidase N-terminal domain-containing protein [Nakamurella sp.]